METERENDGPSGPQRDAAGYVRDGSGRFAPGTRRGPGKPTRTRVLARAIQEMNREDDVRAILSRRIDQALEGDSIAADSVLSTYYRKPRQESPPPVDGFELPTLRDPEDAVEALALLAQAAADGGDPEWIGCVRTSVERWLERHAEVAELRALEARIGEFERPDSPF